MITLGLMLTAAILCLICWMRFRAMRARYAPMADPKALPDDSLVDDLAGNAGPDGAAPDLDSFVERFRQLIRIPTVSWTDHSKRDPALFIQFQETLTDLYPEVHEVMERTVISEFGLIYRWPGRDPGQKPVLCLAHYDVVPAEEKGDETWQVPPFAGEVRDEVLWGRGTLDIKCMIAFYMEAAQTLIRSGWQPRGDIYFAFGGDEEIGGPEGAAKMAARFRDQGLCFQFVMDEGGIIAKNQLAFLKDRPAALVGLAEKGFVTYRVRATGDSGHSSMPGREGTAIGRLARAVARLEKHPFPSRLDPVMQEMLERFVPFVSLPLGLVFSNLWLFSPLIRYLFSRNKVTDSLIRTTQAVTVFKSGEQENILPGEAFCLVNHRILPGDSMAGIKARYAGILKDPGLSVAHAGHWPANEPIPAGDRSGFDLIRSVLAQTHPEAIVVPYLVNGGTDSKYYADLAGQVVRFTPLELSPADVAAIHGINEKVSLANLERGLHFYIRLFGRL